MNRLKRIIFTFNALAFSFSISLLNAQGNLSGFIKDDKGLVLAGANVYLSGTDLGSATDANGKYEIKNITSGNYTLIVSYLGFNTEEFKLNVTGNTTKDASLTPSALEIEALQVTGTIIKDRKTPFPHSSLTADDLELRTASRDITAVMADAPGVYFTEGKGGAGDSRVYIRGFDQENSATLINGVPVNDMENGRMYWSNWDGMTDIASAIQIQKGLGATNLVAGQLGGTINIVSGAATARKGLGYKQEFGSDNFLKTTFTANTGLLDGGIALSALVAKKSWDGYVDATWSEAYSYYFAAHKTFGNGKHTLDANVLGAPQQHGQRDEDQIYTEEDWQNYADATGEDVRRLSPHRYGSGWGNLTKEEFESLNDNYVGHRGSTDWAHDVLFGGIMHTKQVGDSYLINTRTNYYHKPVYSLNWKWNVDESSSLSTTLYGSKGRGGGTGPLNTRDTYMDDNGEDGYQKYYNPAEMNDESGQIDWSQVISNNRYWNSMSEFDDTYSSSMHRSKRIIRASVNHHDWTGVLSTYNNRLTDNLNFTTGFDIRSYAGEHYREVVNLLGGDYYVHHYAKAGETGSERMRGVGGLIDYHNTGYHDWYGGWSQLEYASSAFSVVASGARSVSRYQRQEQYNETEGDEFSKVLIFPGSALKLGLNYNLNDNINIFFAGGQMSKAPKFSNAYLAYSNTPNTGAKNEEITSMDLGVTYRSDLFDVTTTYYMNTWKDKSIVIYDAPDIYNITGLSANHSGLELEADVRPMDLISFEAALSFGNWKWGENVDGTFSSDYDRTNTTDVTLYTDGLMVGYQPQTQMSMGLNLFPMPGLKLNTSFRYNDNFYAGFSPSDYDDVSMQGKDVVKLPSYSLLDLHTSYKMNLMGTNLTLGAHLLNALDSKYITYGEDQGFEDDGSNSSPKVFYGSGMQFRLSFKVSI